MKKAYKFFKKIHIANNVGAGIVPALKKTYFKRCRGDLWSSALRRNCYKNYLTPNNQIIINKLVKRYRARRKKSFKLSKKLIACLLLLPILSFWICTTVLAFGPSGELYDGIDVSGWQGEVDYKLVSEDGVKIVYIKATEGTSFTNRYYLDAYNNAKINGLKVGFYHYVTARSVEEGIAEAEYFSSVIENLEPDCRLAMDFESFGSLTRDEINEISFAFLRRVQELTGKEMVIYSNTNDAANIFSSELAKSYPLWVAQYGVGEPTANGNWEVWIGWQYTSEGRVAGINVNVDRDYFTEDILLSNSSVIPKPNEPINPVPTPEPQETFRYTVIYGDTLSEIALKFNTSVQRLVELNNIANPNLIYVGQILTIPEIGTAKKRIAYTVVRGDTLNKLAGIYNTTVQSIVELNNIKNPSLIYVGQTLIIETNSWNSNNVSYITYTVRRGNTLWRIARRYNTTVSAIVTLNKIQNPNLIYPGQILKIPM
ncbi:MAG: LysM peptidoglycan-binding domain-containing protein [Clostridia bacterium]|nr:LysM peptidoglycan-binding domain-containing protein [Clostridia bacterium]